MSDLIDKAKKKVEEIIPEEVEEVVAEEVSEEVVKAEKKADKAIVEQKAESVLDIINIEDIEKRIEIRKQINRLLPKITYSQDWVDMGGKPYLMGSGAERIMQLVGISLQDVEREERDLPDGHKLFIVRGLFCFKDRCIVAEGIRSTKDKFFAKTKDGWKQIEEIDIPSVMKSAYTNMLQRGVTAILGLKNLTWKQLESVGIKKVHKVTFKNRR